MQVLVSRLFEVDSRLCDLLDAVMDFYARIRSPGRKYSERFRTSLDPNIFNLLGNFECDDRILSQRTSLKFLQVGYFSRSLLTVLIKGLAWPFYHIVKGSSTLIFGTKNWLGLNFGILIVWATISYALLPITVWMEVRKHKENFAKNRREQWQRLRETEKMNISA